MKLACFMLCGLFLQGCDAVAPAPSADPNHLRFSRTILLPAGGEGEACTVLDADVFAQTASRSGADLRVFRSISGAGLTEIPFALTESEAGSDDAVEAKVLNMKQHDGRTGFDVAMPQRPYSRVDLQIAAHDFYAIATVSGRLGNSAPPVYLGSFDLYDLRSRHLSRSTTLALPESSYPYIHVELEFWSVENGERPVLSRAILEGATVPPSREAQTLFTPVAETTHIDQNDGRSVATFHVPAHVPVERIDFKLAPGTSGDFFRHVTIVAKPDQPSNPFDTERIGGEISRAELPLALDANRDTATVRNVAVDATLAANLRTPASVEISVENSGASPLAIDAVQLAMRQRSICFKAVPGADYTLRYGDDALTGAVYEEGHFLLSKAAPVIALLGPERLSSDYVARSQLQSYHKRHAGVLCAALLLLLAAMGAAVRHNVKHRLRRG